jgi:hypothetical protein
MSMIINPYVFGGGGGGGTAFFDAIQALSPQIHIRPVDTSAPGGSAVTNSGSYVGSGVTYAGDVLYNRGSLNLGTGENSVENVANHVVNMNTTAVGAAGITAAAGSWFGVIGCVYCGVGNGTSTTRILFRQASVNLYIDLQPTNITLRLPTGTYDTGIASSSVKDDTPHLFKIVRLASGGVTLYIDGVAVYNVPAGTMSFITGATFQWGRNNNNPSICIGRYSHMFIAMGTYLQAQIDAINAAWGPAF